MHCEKYIGSPQLSGKNLGSRSTLECQFPADCDHWIATGAAPALILRIHREQWQLYYLFLFR